MKYRIVCDKTNNTYKDELEEVVNIDFFFEGVRKGVRVTMKCAVPEADFSIWRDDLFQFVPSYFEEISGKEAADWVNSQLVQNQNGYAKKKR